MGGCKYGLPPARHCCVSAWITCQGPSGRQQRGNCPKGLHVIELLLFWQHSSLTTSGKLLRIENVVNFGILC